MADMQFTEKITFIFASPNLNIKVDERTGGVCPDGESGTIYEQREMLYYFRDGLSVLKESSENMIDRIKALPIKGMINVYNGISYFKSYNMTIFGQQFDSNILINYDLLEYDREIMAKLKEAFDEGRITQEDYDGYVYFLSRDAAQGAIAGDMGRKFMAAVVLFHEYGHFIDQQKGYISFKEEDCLKPVLLDEIYANFNVSFLGGNIDARKIENFLNVIIRYQRKYYNAEYVSTMFEICALLCLIKFTPKGGAIRDIKETEFYKDFIAKLDTVLAKCES